MRICAACAAWRLGEPETPRGLPVVAARERVEPENLLGHRRSLPARDGIARVLHLDHVRSGCPEHGSVHRGQAQQAVERNQPRLGRVLRTRKVAFIASWARNAARVGSRHSGGQSRSHEIALEEATKRLRDLRQAHEGVEVGGLGPHHVRGEPVGVIVVQRRSARHQGAQCRGVGEEEGAELEGSSRPASRSRPRDDGSRHWAAKRAALTGPCASRVPASIHSRPWPLQSEQSSKAAQKPPITARISVSSSW